MHRVGIATCVAVVTAFLIATGARPLTAQKTTADLVGRVLNPQGQPVQGARVRVESQETGNAKEMTTDANGGYLFFALSPGAYRLTVLAQGFATVVNPSLTLTVGRRNVYDVRLQAAAQARAETLTDQPQAIQSTDTSATTTILGGQIESLPINRRDYIRFSLLSSPVKPDNTPLTGPAPTSGLDFNGQRARGNHVLVDGTDATDASVNGIRSTLPQSAVREFEVLQNNYMPEYGRATGGVLNIVSRAGTNAWHGDVFGYVRNSRFQSRNPFSFEVNPTTGQASPIKQPYTRVQAGASVGGALRHNRLFYFFSFEALRKQGTGFSSIGTDNFGLSEATVPCVSSPLLLTSGQASFFQSAIPAAGGCGSTAGNKLAQEASVYGAASSTALYGNSASGPGNFPLPVDCVGGGCTSANVVPLPASFVGLASVIGNYPTTEKTYIGSFRLDRVWNPNQHTFVRATISPSYQTGIQVIAPNQGYGLNAGSRTSVQRFLDQTGMGQHTMILSSTLVNVTRVQYARRGLHFGGSPLTGGDYTGVNIPGFAYLGQDPLAEVDRTEKRWEVSDNVTWVHGHHTMKFGVDGNFLRLTSAKSQTFDLNYAGVYNFGAVNASSIFGQAGLPTFTTVQAYGLGTPQEFTQGIGKSFQPFSEKRIGGFWQDSWQATRRLTLNFGVRYDVAFPPTFTAATTLNQDAASALHVVEGLPRDYKDISPRLGLAWDPTGNGKSVVRAAFGVFYDVTPLALIYNASAADGALSTQLQLPAGSPTGIPVSPTTALQTLNASSTFQGVLGGIPTVPATGTTVCGTNQPPTMGYECAQQRFNATLTGSIFSNQNYISQGYPIALLPFVLPVANNFVNAYAQQGNLSVEHEFARNIKVGVSYRYVRGLHLDRPRNINQTDPVLLTRNFANAVEAGLQPTNPLAVHVPQLSPGACRSTSVASSYQVVAPGWLAEGFNTANCTGAPFGYIGTPAVFNYFRPSGPNPSYGGANTVDYAQLVALAKQAGFPTGYGIPVAWSDVTQQESTGTSKYNGLTVTVSKSFSNHLEFLSSWTWSHALDNATDFWPQLGPQNNSNPNREWGNSTFDQRQRWVTSAVFDSPYTGKQTGLLKRLVANAFAAPIVEFASGRPFTVLTASDLNLNFNSNTDRPSVVPVGTPGSVTSPYIGSVAFAAPTVCASGIPATAQSPFGETVPVQPYGCDGSLGRNTYVTPRVFSIDLRIDKKFYLSERMNFEFIVDMFNLLNRNNVLAVNQMCNPQAGVCSAGQPTASLNPRQFQFALKFNF